MSTIAKYTIGPYGKPVIRHDNGFLDQFPKRAPTVPDQLQHAWWVTQLNAGEAAQKVPFLPHNDISDALAAYRHFIEGSGTDRTFSYERYVANDPSGKLTLKNAIADVVQGAWEVYQLQFKGKSSAEFEITSSALTANSGSATFPYPATENWQKAIGAHNFWLYAKVQFSTIGTNTEFQMALTLYAEDMYNFNPGAADIATGIPDAANGVFEVTGLAKQYLNVSQLERDITWRGAPTVAITVVAPSSPRRVRQPSDNSRVRNRL